ncbi:MAG: class I SAM-dependent methyltransferase [Crinalium sp.]
MLLNSNSVLCKIITDQIAQAPNHQINFAEYMDLVLYHPQHGYYAANATNIGAQGDFVTSPHFGTDFGELLAEQFVEMWEILGNPPSFQLVEMGAGQGLIAADVLRYLHQHHPNFFNSLEYIIVEKAAAMITQQQQFLQRVLPDLELHIKWSNLEEISDNSIVGCCFSNELVDALPVHQIRLEKGQLREIYVTTPSFDKSEEARGDSEFVEVTDELSTPQLSEYFDLVGIDLSSDNYQEGYRTEVNLAALDWIKTISNKLKQGYLLTIDYGYTATRYYNPQRYQGTLQCYYQHAHHNDPYINIGYQDITAHVDFTALELQGELCGLQKVGFTQQGLFLMALGLGDRISAISTSSVTDTQGIQQVLQRRDALHQLINPMGLGKFGVLIQSKGLSEDQQRQLKGLSMPTM